MTMTMTMTMTEVTAKTRRRSRRAQVEWLVVLVAAGCHAQLGAPAVASAPATAPEPSLGNSGPRDSASTASSTDVTPAVSAAPVETGAGAVPNDAAVVQPLDDGARGRGDPKPGIVPFERLQPFYAVSVHEGWVGATLPITADIDSELMDRVVEADRSLWRGHPLEPAALAAMPPIYIVTTRGVVVAEKYSRFGVSRDDGAWYVEYRNLRVKAPAIAMAGEPVGQARLRLAHKAKPIRASHRLAKRMREVALEAANAGAPGAPTVEMVKDLATYTLQEIPGSFPQATRIVFVAGDGREDEFNMQTMVVTLDDDGKEHYRDITGPTLTATAVGDLDGDGFDEVLLGYQDYEGVGESLYRFTHGGMEEISLWSSEG